MILPLGYLCRQRKQVQMGMVALNPVSERHLEGDGTDWYLDSHGLAQNRA